VWAPVGYRDRARALQGPGYDPKAFTMVASSPNSPIRGDPDNSARETMAEFIAYAKAHPGEMTSAARSARRRKLMGSMFSKVAGLA